MIEVTIIIVWPALVVTFLVLGGLMLKLCGTTLIKTIASSRGDKVTFGQNDSERVAATKTTKQQICMSFDGKP